MLSLTYCDVFVLYFGCCAGRLVLDVGLLASSLLVVCLCIYGCCRYRFAILI